MRKKLVSFTLALCMVVSMFAGLSVPVFAEELDGSIENNSDFEPVPSEEAVPTDGIYTQEEDSEITLLGDVFPVSSFEELTAALNNNDVQIITVTNDMDILESITINKDVKFLSSLTINNSDVNLTVATGGKLQLGGINNAESSFNNGSVIVQSGGEAIFNQSVVLGEDALLEIQSDGSLTVDKGKVLTLNGQATIDGSLQLNSSDYDDADGAGLVIIKGLSGSGTIFTNKDSQTKHGAWISFEEDYQYEGNVLTVIENKLGSVHLGSHLWIEDTKKVKVNNTTNFYDAVNNTELFAENLEIYVEGDIELKTSLSTNAIKTHVYIEPHVTVTVSNNITIAENILVTVRANNGTYGRINVAAGKILTAYSDWRIYDDIGYVGIMFEDRVYWQGMFGAIVSGYEDESDDDIDNPTYRERYYPIKTVSGTGEDTNADIVRAIKTDIDKLTSFDFLLIGGGVDFTLDKNMTVSNLYIGGRATVTVPQGIILKLQNSGGERWVRSYNDGQYGRDYYAQHSGETGYVNVGYGSTLNVEGTLDNSITVDWTHTIVINEDEKQHYSIGRDNVTAIVSNCDLAKKMGVDPLSLLVSFSKENDIWMGKVDVDGGQLNIGTDGVFIADRLWVGISSGNDAKDFGYGFDCKNESGIRLNNKITYSINDNLEIPGMEFYGDVFISPNCEVTLTENLTVNFGELRIYGKLARGVHTVTAENGIYRMYHNQTPDSSYRLADTDFDVTYVGVDNDNALKALLENREDESIAILFNWCLNGNSPFSEATVNINANLYNPYSIEVYDGRKININGELTNGRYSRLRADGDNVIISAGSILNSEDANMEACNGGLIESTDLENKGYVNSYDNGLIKCVNLTNQGDVNAGNRGQVWITGTVNDYNRLNGNVYYQGLAARGIRWENDTPFIDENDDIMHSLSLTKGIHHLMFYYLEYNGTDWTLNHVNAEQLILTKTDGDTGTNECKPYNEDITELKLDDWEAFTLSYEDTLGTTYTFDISVELPTVGFYSALGYEEVDVSKHSSVDGLYTFDSGNNTYTPAVGEPLSGETYYSYGASKENWISDLTYTPGTQQSFYFIYNDNVNPSNHCEMYIDKDNGGHLFSGIDNVNISSTPIYSSGSTIWEIKLKETATGFFKLNLAVKIEEYNGGWFTNDAWLNLNCADYEHLVWLHSGAIEENKFHESSTNEGMAIKDERHGAFFLYTYNADSNKWTYVPVDSSDLVFTDANGNEINPSQYSLNINHYYDRGAIYRLTYNIPGRYTVKYSTTAYTCAYGVAYDVIYLPDLGAYETSINDIAYYYSNNSVDYAHVKTFYIIPATGKSLKGMDLNNTRVGTDFYGKWRDESFGESAKQTFNGAFEIEAVNADGDSAYDYFIVRVLANPFNGYINFNLNIRDNNGREFLQTNVGLNPNLEKAIDVDAGEELSLSNPLKLDGLSKKCVRYHTLQVTNPGIYTFDIGTETGETSGDVGLYVFDYKWNMIGNGNRNYVDKQSTLRSAYVLENSGTYYVAVYNHSGETYGDDLMLKAVESYQPDMPTGANAWLSFSENNIYSVYLTKCDDTAGGEGRLITEYKLYAFIDGEWRYKDSRKIWHYTNENNETLYNTEMCYLVDILENGETATKFGVRAVNKDGISSEMLELTPDHPVTRDDSAFDADACNLNVMRLPNGEVEMSISDSSGTALFTRISANRLFFYGSNGTDGDYEHAELNFGNGRNNRALRTHYDEDIRMYTNGYWEYLVSGQMLSDETYTVGWSTAAKDCVGMPEGTDKKGSITLNTLPNSWIVRDNRDLTEIDTSTNEPKYKKEFFYDSDMTDWYTYNSGRFWLGTYDAGTNTYSYTDITKDIESTDVTLNYNSEWNSMEYSLLRRQEGSTFNLTYAKDSVSYTLTIMVVQPEFSFYNTATASKDSFIVENISSTLNEFYFILSDSYLLDHSNVAFDVAVYKPAVFGEDINETYYYRNDKGRYIVASSYNSEYEYFVRDMSSIGYMLDGLNKLRFYNSAHKGDFDITITLRRDGTEIDYMSKWVYTPDDVPRIKWLDIVEASDGVTDLTIGYYLDSTYNGSKLIFASYADGKMVEVRMFDLTPNMLGNGGFVADKFAAGDEYKVFILNGSSYSPQLYITKDLNATTN